ncbi:MAG: SDR family oxidoreductase, partial [Flavobacteriales bacterium]|nr:SDR family oxidoreductase [Flavobacteriales bacterium]
IEGESINEEALLEAKTVYAVNKIACENYLDLYQRCFGIDYLIYRISLPYGSSIPQMKMSYGVMSYFIDQASKGRTLKIYGAGQQQGTLIHIDDLVKIMIESALNPAMKNGIYNIGGNDTLKIRDVIEAIGRKYNVKVEKVNWPDISNFAEHGDLILDSSRIESAVDYKVEYDFITWLSKLKIESF